MMLPTTLYLFSTRPHDHAKAEEHFCDWDTDFVSLLSGTFICTFSQKNLESSANKTIQVFSLPLKQNIMINPIEAPIQCNKPEALQCCIRAHSMEDYNVTFMVEHKEVPFGKKQKTCRMTSCTMYHNPVPGVFLFCFHLVTAIITPHKYSWGCKKRIMDFF